MAAGQTGAPASYRADIDGLRAIAVLGVVLYHGFPAFLPGGFVGVDVFIVISGYLITRIIADEARAGTFSISRFYERRFRRILPALVIVLLATTLAAALILPPGELAEYGQSLLSVAVFVSNMLFWHEGGYFDAPSADKPLLHTWSLAVEEQFYIFWPLIAAALLKFGRARGLTLFVWLVVIGSLAASELMVRRSPVSAFYLIPFRSWELGLGALVAIDAIPRVSARAAREWLAAAGLLLVVCPMAFYSDSTPFPGLHALPPCLGTMLLIHVGQDAQTKVARLVAAPPLVWVGLVSYSFYLWHWPILVLAGIRVDRPLDTAETAIAIASALGLAALSLIFVEQPFRKHGRLSASKRTVLIAGAGAMFIVATIGGVLWQSNGFISLRGPEMRAAEAAKLDINPLRGTCHATDGRRKPAAVALCTRGAGASRAGAYDVLLWGDSHADHLMPGLAALGRERGFRVRQATYSGCGLLVLATPQGAGQSPCAVFHRAVLAEISERRPSAVVISGRWATAVMAFQTSEDGKAAASDRAADRRLGAALEHLVAMVRQAAGPRARIVIVGSSPEFDFWPATCLARAVHTGRPAGHCETALARDARWSARADRIIADIAPGAAIAIFPRPAFCNGTSCQTFLNGQIAFRDDDHLSTAGSRVVATMIVHSLEKHRD